MGGSMFPNLFIGFFILIGVGVLAFAFRALYLAKAAENWPVTEGRIISSDFKVNSDEDGTTYGVTLSYQYSVHGADHMSKRIAFGYANSSMEAFHRSIYTALPINTVVGVRYDPNNPDRSVLSYGINRSIKFLLVFGAIWTVFSVGMAVLFGLSGSGANTLLSNIIIYGR